MIITSASQFPSLLETPGIYYATAYWVSSVIMLHMVPGKVKGWKAWAITIPSGAVLAFFMALTKGIPIYLFIPTMAICTMILFFLFYATSDLPVRGCIYFAARSFMYGEFVASFGWQLMAFGIQNWHMRWSLMTNLIFYVPTYLVLYGILILIERRYIERNKEMELTMQYVLGATCIVILIYTLSNLSFVARNTPFSARYTSEILLLRTTLDASGVVILFLYHVVLNQMQASMEAKTLQNMLDAQYANYRISRDSVDLVNQKYHDLKHQIAILRAESNSDEKMQYLDKMEREIKQYEAQNKTGNNILDIILTSKSLACQRHHTELTVVADGAAINFMEPMDISSLFGNALDNALESVCRIDNYAERLIHLTVVRQKAFVHISVENRFEGEVKFRNGLPVTTKKKDVGYHGFGVKSMRSTAEKYGGSLTVGASDGWFRLNILMPYQEAKKPGSVPKKEK